MYPRLRAFFTHPGHRFSAPHRIFWVALVVRLLYITLAHSYHLRTILDHFQFGWELGRISRALVTGRGYADPFIGPSGPTAWIPPLYTLILAGVFKLFGIYTPLSAWVILAVNSVFSAATCLGIYELAARCYDAYGHGRRIALWSAWLWALYPAAMQYAVHWVWDMTLTNFLFVWALVFALRVRGIGEPQSETSTIQTSKNWATFGLLWGLIALSNPSLLIILPPCSLWMLWGARANLRSLTAATAKAVLAAVIVVACIAPWAWRNWHVLHAFIPTRDNLGVELYHSTLVEHDGFPWGAALPLAVDDPDFMHYKAIGEVAYAKEKGKIAKTYIRQHPVQIAKWRLKRIYFFWAGVPHPIEGSPLVEYTREINYGFFSVTGLLGLFLSLQRRVPAAWLFATVFLLEPLIYYAITVQARFRHPLEPLIAIFTVFLFQSAETRSTKRAAHTHPSAHKVSS